MEKSFNMILNCINLTKEHQLLLNDAQVPTITAIIIVMMDHLRRETHSVQLKYCATLERAFT